MCKLHEVCGATSARPEEPGLDDNIVQVESSDHLQPDMEERIEKSKTGSTRMERDTGSE